MMRKITKALEDSQEITNVYLVPTTGTGRIRLEDTKPYGDNLTVQTDEAYSRVIDDVLPARMHTDPDNFTLQLNDDGTGDITSAVLEYNPETGEDEPADLEVTAIVVITDED